jgi:hypothetical protein
MTHNLKRRVDALELRSQPTARVVVCWCSLPDGQHQPDCPAAGAALGDHVVSVRWQDDDD